jgi:hypothetical protein
MAGARNRFVFAVVGVQLINILADQKCFDAVARQESQRFLKDVELSQRCSETHTTWPKKWATQ